MMNQQTGESNAVRYFSGKGWLRAGESWQLATEFRVTHDRSSSITAYCDATATANLQPNAMYEALTLEGTLDDGMPLIMRDAHPISITRSLSGSDCRVVLSGRSFEVGKRAVTTSGSAHFCITNLEFAGTTHFFIEADNGLSKRGAHCLPLILNGNEVHLKQLYHYSDNLRFAKETRGVAVTAELVMTVKTQEHIGMAQEMADDVCLLLSLARSCRVVAMNCEVRGASGEIQYYFGRRVPQKRYALLGTKELDPHWAQGTKRFVECSYPYLCKAKTDWAFDKAIEIYLDAKRDGDEFELWGLKMAVCMEFLYAKYLANGGQKTILPPNQFQKVQSSIRESLKRTLSETVDDISPDQVDAVVEKVGELNRPSFGKSLIALNAQVGARIQPTAVKRFVKIRNALVHRGTYESAEKYGLPADQYAFLDSYVYRFLLGLVGNPLEEVYDGYTYTTDGASVSSSYAQGLA